MKFPLFDAHCDTLSAMLLTKCSLGKNNLHVDLQRGGKYRPYAQFFAAYGQVETPAGQLHVAHPLWKEGWSCFQLQYGLFREALSAYSKQLTHCLTAREAKEAGEAGKIAAFLAIEGAELLDCSLDRLAEAYVLGLRMLTLTWNIPNALSGTVRLECERGLSDLGRQFVRRCKELGIIVDVSHLSEPGFWDVAEVMEGVPFVASHSNSAKIYPHPRNLTDAQFLEIVKAGGIVGLNLFTIFLGDGMPGIDRAIAHVEHFLSLGGEKTVAIGADLDGCETLPPEIRGIEDVEKIAEELLRRNYSEALVCDIMYYNLFRVVEEICGI